MRNSERRLIHTWARYLHTCLTYFCHLCHLLRNWIKGSFQILLHSNKPNLLLVQVQRRYRGRLPPKKNQRRRVRRPRRISKTNQQLRMIPNPKLKSQLIWVKCFSRLQVLTSNLFLLKDFSSIHKFSKASITLRSPLSSDKSQLIFMSKSGK